MYDLFEHRHRFSVWAAARAAQRGLASVDTLRDAIEKCGIVEFVRTEAAAPIDEERFAQLHRIWCHAIVRQLQDHGVAAATYGRAAKLVAVYLKGMIVIGPKADTELACVAHPPVDRILLQNMSNATEVQSPSKRAWRHINWTQLDEESYHRLIRELKGALADSEPFWKLERFWTVTEE